MTVMDSTQWYFAAHGNGYGPFTFEQIHQLAQTEMLSPSDFVWQQDETEARHVSEVDGLLYDRVPLRAPSRLCKAIWFGPAALLLLGGLVAFYFLGDGFQKRTTSGNSGMVDAKFEKTSDQQKELSIADDSTPTISNPTPSLQSADSTVVASNPKQSSADVVPPKSERKPGDNLISMIDPSRHTLRGQWRRDNTNLRCDQGGTLVIANETPRRFELKLHLTRTRGRTAFGIGLVRKDIKVLAMLDHYEGSGLELIDGMRRGDNDSFLKKDLFELGRESEVVFRVDGQGVRVAVDGHTVIDWKGSYSRLSISGTHRIWGAPTGKLCLYSDESSSHVVSSIRLRSLDDE
jgi:GYF domain 2